MLPLYEELYREDRESGAAIAAYRKRLEERCTGYNTRFSLPPLVPHSVYRDRLHNYDEMNVLLRHMAELYASRRVDTRPLEKATEKYLAWLNGRKSEYNRKRSVSYRWLERELTELVTSGAIAGLLENERLADFFYDVVIERKIFDYVKLEVTASG